MRASRVVLRAAVAAVFLGACGFASASDAELVAHTYDSFVAKGGLGPEVASVFEKTCKAKLKYVSSGDAAQMLARVQGELERDGRSQADVMIGLDQNLWPRARKYAAEWRGWKPRAYGELVPDAKVEEGFLPFDYGVFALMADRESLVSRKIAAPKRLSDLLRPEFKRSVILEDPRTSTPGLAFVLFAESMVGKAGSASFWKSMSTQWLTLTPGWSGAYGLFLKGQAPLVWSYTTSQAYHEENGDGSGRYGALVFEEGNPVQIEGAALVRGVEADAARLGRARCLLEVLVSKEVQARVGKTQWMFPALKGASTPGSFAKLPRPAKLIRVTRSAEEVDRILSDWGAVVSGAR